MRGILWFLKYESIISALVERLIDMDQMFDYIMEVIQMAYEYGMDHTSVETNHSNIEKTHNMEKITNLLWEIQSRLTIMEVKYDET